MRLIFNYLFTLLLGVGAAAAIAAGRNDQNSKTESGTTVCYRVLVYDESISKVSPGQEMNLADSSDPNLLPWRALGYRLVRSCATAQIQIENEVRLIGPASDPASRAMLTLILRASGRAPEKINIPYTSRLRPEDNYIVGKKFGAVLPDIMTKIDPTLKTRLQEYMRKHPEDDPNRK
jgi:hypothetical protein